MTDHEAAIGYVTPEDRKARIIANLKREVEIAARNLNVAHRRYDEAKRLLEQQEEAHRL